MIRLASVHEAKSLSELALRSKAHWGYSDTFLQACRAELTVEESEIADHNVFVLERAGVVLGFHSLEHISSHTVELGFLFIEPAEIGFGHGRSLATHAIAEAKKRGYQTLLIQGDPNAEAFYEAIGASKVGSRESASVPGRQLPLLEVTLGREGCLRLT